MMVSATPVPFSDLFSFVPRQLALPNRRFGTEGAPEPRRQWSSSRTRATVGREPLRGETFRETGLGIRSNDGSRPAKRRSAADIGIVRFSQLQQDLPTQSENEGRKSADWFDRCHEPMRVREASSVWQDAAERVAVSRYARRCNRRSTCECVWGAGDREVAWQVRASFVAYVARSISRFAPTSMAFFSNA